ncbi:hypothetical protein K2Z83_15415 [Oscillochloris sp. ZM17-4]|uniref:hypothetical protein n=1 Tax=Oscillochloris sp. ZM17-4 TaxID=2866714 RepID=UPI001C72B965|nr:hypothetical protein [Oscillochloris sp. ZM17-4]MBX0329067.1 hypothetical protein [Oscillochloris sp. ZM17-4]
MDVSSYHRSKLLALIAAIIALTLCAAPAPQAQAQPAPPDWYAWHLKVDFPGPSPRVIMTSYWGLSAPTLNQPVSVTGSSQLDISTRCTVVGSLPVVAGTATFDGSSYIRCRIPSSAVSAMDEQCAGSSAPFFWGALRGTIAPGSISNPIFTLSNSVTHTPVSAFSLPSNGVTAQSSLRLPSTTYTSAAWNLNAAENRVLMSSDGVSIAEITSYFAADSWLSFMNTISSPNRTKVGNWAEPSLMYWQTSRKPEGYRLSDTFDIGYNPATGSYFAGTMSDGEFDPPGCTAK